jgi:DNA repair exonuclease SbcCD ATPase subunit
VQQKNAEMQARIEKAEQDAAEKKKVVKALQDFKYYINTYFLPSVAKAASRMLRTMTNGVRKKLHISDKFDILVDGQAVETMSGSAKALVNIALRLALQYVLTKNTFSVFMGDEIDASMDSDRAKYLAECLNNTTDHIKQIIVISHRDITADHQIAL